MSGKPGHSREFDGCRRIDHKLGETSGMGGDKIVSGKMFVVHFSFGTILMFSSIVLAYIFLHYAFLLNE